MIRRGRAAFRLTALVEDGFEHVAIGRELCIGQTLQRRAILRLDPRQCTIPLDLFEPEIRIIVRRFDCRTRIGELHRSMPNQLETIANNNAAIESRVPGWEHARRRIDRKKGSFWSAQFCTEVARPARFELTTSAFGGQRSALAIEALH